MISEETIRQYIDEGLRCIGCGALIQTENKNEIGYTPMSALKKSFENDEVFCQRCFRLRHYNEIQPVNLTDDDFRHLLEQIADTNSLVVYVMDVFDFSGSLIPGLHRFVGNNDVLLVGNKVDVLPRSLKRSKIKDWMRQQANIAGLRPVDVALTSGKNGEDIEKMLDLIAKYRKNRSVYVVGVTNVGKSTLINQVIKSVTGDRHDVITTSRFPGTTLDRIEIPLDDDSNIIDTPGIIHQDQMAHYLSAKDLKYVSPQKEIKPKTFQLNEGQTLFMGALARFDYIQGQRTGITAYFENNLLIHRTKLANADAFYEKHAGDLLAPPTAENLAMLPPLQRYEFKTTEKTDIVIDGLGWLTVPANTVVAGWAPKGVSVLTRRAMI
ncbi:ribosome biogenesis GTPase YqeH [Weissella sagaensis]|uniref:Ribosome biogenesis GTPase YqeH n=1 Tax=Weissella sagaensis TaxID=2559928 RepID=A0ABW1RTZ5_9LACO|nr:ribosome biogenesis GTPase YqeH [Weissella sagaensis]KAA8433262.1 ribosome biogenesis GTPase YqeH [Weissella paramesenteroides]MBU7567186.1 ribosome biogenesis GTPase YqeH [Weissella hellenica]KAA8439308.1 ribosome biogenesis GTPase YqeH [Weissella paramesenteroides]QDJ59241.1 ribosome biogenesis GTPase YqeH [Weissella hellenica]QEA56536.1 ribosome biogenesis GTPase YqeH [Weissella hellenica]